MLNNFVRLARDGMTTLLAPWLVIAAVDLGFVAAGALTVGIAGTASPGTAGGVVLQLIGAVQLLVIMAFRIGLLNTLRDVALEGASTRSLGGIVRDVLARFGSSLLVAIAVGVIVGVGLMLCIVPGVLALFFLAFAPYLVAARDVPVFESLTESAKWARQEWAVLLSGIVVAVLAVGFVGCASGIVASISPREAVGVATGLFGGWVVSTVVGYVAYLWWGAVYVTAESREHLETFERTGPRTYQSPDEPGEGLRDRAQSARERPPEDEGREGPQPEQGSEEGPSAGGDDGHSSDS